MSRDLLFPTHLDAVVVAPGAKVPTAALATGLTFTAGADLTPGVHLHWALPDPLTQAEAPTASGRELQLPPVPDRWLLIRVAPPVGTTPRATRAWVIESAHATVTDLGRWNPATTRPALAGEQRLTTLGLLKRARIDIDDRQPIGAPLTPTAHPGGRRGDERAVDVVYYPLARNRFGFHDSQRQLDDDGIKPGKLTYLVVGWYSDRALDPMNVSAAVQRAWLAARRVTIDDASDAAAVVKPTIGAAPSRPGVAGVAAATTAAADRPPGPLLGVLVSAFARAGVSSAIGGLASVGAGPAAISITGGPATGDRLVCHGAVTSVPWRQDGPSVPEEPGGSARLYGSLREAAERYFADLANAEWMRSAIGSLLGRAAGDSDAVRETLWQGHLGGFISRLGESAIAPRFHGPDAPALLIAGLPRSPRHGEDADLDPDRKEGQAGRVRVRTNDKVVSALSADLVTGAGNVRITIQPRNLAAPVDGKRVAGDTLGPIIESLLHETMLLDHGNLDGFARAIRAGAGAIATDGAIFTAAVSMIAAWTNPRDAAERVKARATFEGRPPASYAVKGWWPAALPLYVEVTAVVRPDTSGAGQLPPGWELGPIDLVRPEGALPPTLGNVRRFSVRRLLTPVLARMLGTVTVSDAVRAMRLLSCSLPEVDGVLADAAVRAGTLEVEAVRVIDTFGMTYDLEKPLALELVPRLNGWARIQARLRDRSDLALEADDSHSPVCGFVIPDRVDHALEIFDAAGARVGQLRDDPRRTTRTVVWEPDPFRGSPPSTGAAIERPRSDPAAVLASTGADAVLLAFVRGLLMANSGGLIGGDTSVSALMQAIDTLQPTADRTGGGDEVGLLLGRPLALVRITAQLELANLGGTPADAAEPISVGGVPAKVAVPLAFGAVTRPDDGVFGYFVGDDYQRFHPVDARALVPADAGDAVGAPQAITHPYVLKSAVYPLPAGAAQAFTLLVDPRLAIHVRTGVLPAKRIGLPPAMYQPALGHLMPSIRVGPVLLPPTRPWLPAPFVPSGGWQWLHVRPVEPGGVVQPPVSEPLAVPGAGESLAESPPVVQQGWLRLVPRPRS